MCWENRTLQMKFLKLQILQDWEDGVFLREEGTFMKMSMIF